VSPGPQHILGIPGQHRLQLQLYHQGDTGAKHLGIVQMTCLSTPLHMAGELSTQASCGSSSLTIMYLAEKALGSPSLSLLQLQLSCWSALCRALGSPVHTPATASPVARHTVYTSQPSTRQFPQV